MKNTIKVINELKKIGLIQDYAIGGGIAALFYIEPFLTYDLDVFIIPSEKIEKKNVIVLSTLFDFLKNKGYRWKGEHILIEGIPVQFIPADELENDAVVNAKETRYEGIETRIIRAEYLIPILLRAGRTKDREKVERLLDQGNINKKKLNTLLQKYGLTKKLKV